MTRAFTFLFSLVLTACMCTLVSAQSLSLEKPITLQISPENPEPHEMVHLTIQSYAIDLNRSDITWRANDTVIAQGAGIKEATFTTGDAGEETTIVVTAIDPDEEVGRVVASVIPTEVDLLWDSDSYVPPFFKGRTPAGTGANVHLYAAARFPTLKGVFVSDSDIIYTWSQNGTILGSKSGRGRSSITIPGPALFGADSVKVDAETVDKTMRGSATAQIPAADTHLVLYENHPLFGILFHRAIIGDVNTKEKEQKVTVVPYFAHITSPSDPSLSYDWHVNDTRIAPDPHNPETLTIAANNYNGPASIALTLSSASDILMHATGLWSLIFSDTSSLFGGTTNGFGQ